MKTKGVTARFATGALVVLALRCSSDQSGATAHGTGGASASHAADASVAGDATHSGVAGAHAVGGAPATGGEPAADAAPNDGGSGGAANGGATGRAGEAPNVGASGGAANGGAASGGASNGGAANGGAAGKPVAAPSTGCGKANPPASGAYKLDVSGTSRDYVVTLPTAYDATKAYLLILAFHGSSGTAQNIAGMGWAGYFGIEGPSKGAAIFAAAQGLSTNGTTGWPNTGGQDVAFVRALVESLRSTYCVDTKRVFAVGFSYGAVFTNTLGCQMGDVFRAIAPFSGAGPRVPSGGKCVGQVGAFISHGNMDMNVPFTSGEASRDFWVAANHCTKANVQVSPAPCVAYKNCDAGFPVTWCEFDGPHTVPSFVGGGVWAFLSQF